MNNQYIIGITPLTEEPINLDEEKKEEVEEKKGEDENEENG